VRSFSEVRIGDIARAKGGKRLPKGASVQDAPTPHPYLRVVDFGESGIDRSAIRYIDENVHHQIRRYTINSSEVYISIAGTIGRVGMVPKDLSGANLTENAAKLTDISNDVDARYLMYFLRGATGQAAMANQTGGTSQPKLALYRIEEIRFPCPPRGEQQAIVSILSAYDDLIENNRRRIALLEEAARLLYREWFVHFRFPGHEHVPLTDGLPEGWERRDFGRVAQLNYGKALKAENRVDGPFPVYGSSGQVGTHDKALVEAPAIVVGRKGNVGSVYWCPENFWPIDTAYFISKEQSDYWLYLTLPNIGFQNTDSGVPGLNRDFAYSRKVIVPSEKLRREFNLSVQPMLEQIQLLGSYNQKLAQARDLLLPRLMNGEIAV
jgi:type I restriction enzyme S subunit